ncbi:MAG: carboxypeptidase-like regulatory domain-containing protein [Bacteroidales bacterium]|nr:carboxypeptidase-like regulatory domain-containing protein [Bacteroidales bacterium]
MKTIIFTFIVSVAFVLSQAQTGNIKGTVTQEDNLSVLPGVNVYLENTNYGSMTNGKGNYIIKDVPVGSYKLVISNIGYLTKKRK